MIKSIFRLNPRLSYVSLFLTESFIIIAVIYLPYSKSVAEICIITALGLWVTRKFPWDEKFSSVPIYFAGYGVFLVILLLSLIHVPQEYGFTAARGFFKWFKYIAIFFMCLEMYKDPKRVERLMLFFLGTMVVVTLNGFYQMETGLDFFKGYSAYVPGRLVRMQSSFSSPNDLAAFYLVALPCMFYFWHQKKRWSPKSAVYASCLVFFGTAFLMTLSRSAFLALVVAAGTVLIMKRQIKVLALLGGVAGLIFSFSDTLRYNFLTSINFSDITVGERLEVWSDTWNMIQAHPFLGHGVNMYYQVFPLYALASDSYRGYAHNCYLQMWSEIGVFGLLAFLVPPVVVVIGYLAENRREAQGFKLKDALFVGITAFYMQSFFDTNFYALQASVLFWVFWGLFNALNDGEKQLSPTKE